MIWANFSSHLCRRCMLLSRVIEDPTGHYRICFRDKVTCCATFSWCNLIDPPICFLLTGSKEHLWYVSHTKQSSSESLSAQDNKCHGTHVSKLLESIYRKYIQGEWKMLLYNYTLATYCVWISCRIGEALYKAKDVELVHIGPGQ